MSIVFPITFNLEIALQNIVVVRLYACLSLQVINLYEEQACFWAKMWFFIKLKSMHVAWLRVVDNGPFKTFTLL